MNTISTITYDHLIDPRHFPGYRVVKSFYASVAYELNEVGQTKILRVAFDPATLKIIGNMASVMADIEESVLNNADYYMNREPEGNCTDDKQYENVVEYHTV